MNNKEMFFSYSSYLRNKYGKLVYRVSVDGGFSCPNRNSDGTGGCTYCDELGSVAVYQRGQESDLARLFSGKLSEENPQLISSGRGMPMDVRKKHIEEQVHSGIAFLRRRYGAQNYILYFQAFTGTFGSVGQLKELYDFALSLADFKELIISTRPDCVTSGVADLLASYMQRGLDVWAELGLQSGHNITLERINRQHTKEDFERAFFLLRKKGIKITVHLIFGLPGEGRKEILETVNYIASLKPEGIKIHNLHIPIRTELFKEYLMGELTIPSGYRHLSYVIEALENIPSDIIIHRLTCDTPPHRLGAPRAFFKKGTFLHILEKSMAERGSYQGKRL